MVACLLAKHHLADRHLVNIQTVQKETCQIFGFWPNERAIVVSNKQCSGQMSFCQMSFSRMTVSQMSVGQLSVGRMSVGQVPVDKIVAGEMSVC